MTDATRTTGGGPGRLRGLALRLALAAAGLAIALALAEGLLRLASPVPFYSYPGQLYREHPTRYYEMVPGFQGYIAQPDYRFEFQLNSLGYRERELDELPAGPRVWLLGDSVVFGQGVASDQAMSVVMEELLAGSPGTHVVNGGVGGYGTVNTVAQLVDHADEVQPDLVILALNLSNDFEDNLLAPEMVVRGGHLGRTRAGGGGPGPVDLWLRAHLRTYQLARRVLDPPGRRGPQEVVQEEQIFQVPPEPPGQPPHMVDLSRRGGPGPRAQAMIDAMDAAVGSLAEEARGRGLALGVVILPDQLSFMPGEMARLAGHFGVAAGEVEPGRMATLAADIARGHDLPVLDLSAAFRASPQPKSLVFRHDTHYSAAGHRLAATTLAPWAAELLE